MEKIIFTVSNGVVVHCEDKKVVSTIDENGQKHLKSFREKNKILFWHFPFVRGIQYFFCGIWGFIKALCISLDVGTKKKNKQNWIEILTYVCTIVLAVVFSAVVIGLLPGKLGYLIVDFSGQEFLRNLVICAIKLTLFFAFLFSLRFFACVSECMRFNKASMIALRLQKSDLKVISKRKSGPNLKKLNHFATKKTKNDAILPNFLEYLVFVFVLDFIVVTLWGASYGFVFNFLLNVAVLILCSGVGFEILWVIENSKLKKIDILQFIIGFLVVLKPSTTHVETIGVALTEINLLCTQKEREFMDDENRKAFSIVYSQVKNKLANAGVTDKSDADWIIATVLGKNRAEIKLLSFVTDKEYEDIMKATERRANGESVDNIFGFTEFYGLTFDVNKKVLTPRMETEILVEQVLKAEMNFKNPTILDLGTGSGAIAISIAKNCDATVTAIDVSKMALATAEANAKKNDVKIEFLHSNLFDGLKRKRKFDIIVSNPPYIPTKEIEKLDKNVRECDPVLALDGGEDGLDFYREIISKAPDRLNNGGLLFFEVGKGQAQDVKKLLKENGFEEIKIIKDYNKIERVICGKRK